MRIPVTLGLAARRSIRNFVVGGPSCPSKREPLLVAASGFALLVHAYFCPRGCMGILSLCSLLVRLTYSA